MSKHSDEWQLEKTCIDLGKKIRCSEGEKVVEYGCNSLYVDKPA